jgi:hypothetical protein
MPHHIRDRGDQTTLEDFRFSTFDSGRLSFVSGVFDDFENAEQAVATLERRGFGKDQISVLMSDEMRRQYLGDGTERIEIEKGTKAVAGLGTGGAIGGVLGAIVGAVAAAGTTLLVPGLGLVVAGPLAAALAGAGAGGATGGLLGTLVGAGMPEYRAKYYEERLKKGGIVVGVEARSENEADAVENELKNHGAEDVKQS